MDKTLKKFDCSGWATRFNVKCSDGRTIRQGSFNDMDGVTVPLVYQHDHNNVNQVLGHALLETRDEGVYAYCSFNETPEGKNAKELVRHGDITSFSIYANNLTQRGADVTHGVIREVSLVLAGANPGAKIEDVMMHSDTGTFEAQIYNDADESLDLDTVKEIIEHADDGDGDKAEKTVDEIINSMTEEQKEVMYALIGAALEDKTTKENSEDENTMKHNVFDNLENENNTFISHSDIENCIADAKRNGSLKEAVSAMLANNEQCLQHGITNIDVLFPDAKLIKAPSTVDDSNNNWVSKVMAGVHHSPFSRVKSSYFDVTGEDARARGYVKGRQKVEEVISALKRSTTPQTIYKLQKLDRDDMVDITDFDVVAYIKQEMRTKLDREIARAILIGDGRPSSSDDKINPLNIRPILGDNSVYSIPKFMAKETGEDEYKFAKRFIKQAIKARKEYKGSGNPTLYCTEDLLTDMLLIEDKNERVIYDTIDKLKTALMVKDIVTVPDFEGVTRSINGKTVKLMGIFVNLNDYNVGADKGGAVNMFDDFDINYNKYEYLIETRCSGALTEPYSAITFEEEVPAQEETPAQN